MTETQAVAHILAHCRTVAVKNRCLKVDHARQRLV